MTVHDLPVNTLNGEPGSLGDLAGTVLARFRPQVTPEDPELVAGIEANLPG